VEPHPTRNGWLADMRPVDGPVLGAQGEWSLVGVTTADTLAIVSEDEARAIEADIIEAMEPFKTRSEALAAEREWLSVNRGL
jgi:hypothetical protein